MDANDLFLNMYDPKDNSLLLSPCYFIRPSQLPHNMFYLRFFGYIYPVDVWLFSAALSLTFSRQV